MKNEELVLTLSKLSTKLNNTGDLSDFGLALIGKLIKKANHKPDQTLLKITGADIASDYYKELKESDLVTVANEIWEKEKDYAYTKCLWVEFPDDRPEKRLDEIVPYPAPF